MLAVAAISGHIGERAQKQTLPSNFGELFSAFIKFKVATRGIQRAKMAAVAAISSHVGERGCFKPPM